MAQKVDVHLEDDLDGGPADEIITFALQCCDYEIDLSAANAEKVREALRPYAGAGRKATRGCYPRPRNPHRRERSRHREDPGLGQGQRPQGLRSRMHPPAH